jgi:hypothetical protein
MGGRLAAIRRAGVPVTNYGLFLGWVNGLIPRALEPLPEAKELSALWKGEGEAARVG